MTDRFRASSALVLVSVLLFTLAGIGLAQTQEYELPGENVFPEGVAASDDGATFYTGSSADGTLFRGDVQSGEVTVLTQSGVIPAALGLELDDHGRLWVAGGQTGQVFAVDAESGELLQTYDTPEALATFINDLVLHEGYVYVTDSARPELFRISAGEEPGELETFTTFENSPVPFDEQFNINGIVPSPDGSALILVHSGNGELYRVDLETQEATLVENSAGAVTNGDGLVLDGNTLYVVRNADSQIDQLQLSDDGSSAESAGDPITDETFIFPATAALANGSLIVTNTQFNQMENPELPFTLSRVELPASE